MRARWTVLVAALGERLDKGRTLGDFESLIDAERLADNINFKLARGYSACPVPFFPQAQSARSALEQLPARMLAGA